MSLNIDPFIAEINQKDLYRPNLFKVEFQKARGKGNNSSFVTIEEPTFGSQFGNALVDKVQANSAAARKVTGLYSPGFIRSAIDAINKGQAGRNIDYSSKYGDYFDTELVKFMPLYVQSVNLPGKNIDVTESRADAEMYFVPTGETMTELTITFIMNANQDQRGYFLYWMEQVYNPTYNTVGFYDQYVENINVKTFDRKGSAKSITEFSDCYPISVGDLQLSYQTNNEVATFDVTFKFKNFGSAVIPDDPNLNFDDAKNLLNKSNLLARQL